LNLNSCYGKNWTAVSHSLDSKSDEMLATEHYWQ